MPESPLAISSSESHPFSAASAVVSLAAALVLLSGCDTVDMDLRPGATSVLQIFQQPSSQEAAAMAIDKYDAEKRYQGTLLLANAAFANEPVYQQLFLDNIKDEDAGVRAVAARAIANHGSPEQVPVILICLKDSEPLVRQEAARALQRLHNPIAVDPLIQVLDPEKETEVDVRAEAASALGQYAEPKVLQTLIASLDDPQLAVNRSTVDSLRTLTGQDFGLDRRAWVRWLDTTKEPFAARAMYQYPYFTRSKYWIEYLPFVPPPPLEPAGTPAGLPPVIN